MPRVFFITGTSTGFGHYYAQEVLNRGDHVVATARNISQLQFKGTTEGNYLATRLEVTEKESIEKAFEAALKKSGRIDVVVNNAGYGLVGCFEEYTESQIRQQMDVNFFGVLDVTRTAMQYMRDHQTPPGGLIQQVTSMVGQLGFPTYSIYCASKWAVEGFTEAVSHEVKPEWKIKFTVIKPGGFRYVTCSSSNWLLLSLGPRGPPAAALIWCCQIFCCVRGHCFAPEPFGPCSAGKYDYEWTLLVISWFSSRRTFPVFDQAVIDNHLLQRD